MDGQPSGTSDQQISPQQTQQGTPAGASVSDVVVALNNGNRNMSALIQSVQGALAAVTAALERVPVVTFHQQTLEVVRPTITAITNTNPGTLTIPGHTMVAGDTFFVRGVTPGFDGSNNPFVPPHSMVEINFINQTVTSVAGDVVTVAANLSNTALFHPFNATLGGYVCPQLTRGTFTWPAGVDEVHVRMWGSGAAGGGSIWVQYGAAGAGGAYLEGIIPRPVSGVTAYVIDDGMRGIPANTHTLSTEAFFSGPTAFGPYTLVSGTAYRVPPVNQNGSTPVYTGDLICYGANNGQGATSANTGGDGGAGGVGLGTYATLSFNGGQGGASAPTVSIGSGSLFNASFPVGATGAGGGGYGGNNGQDGFQPGGGGASGNIDGNVAAGFQATSYNNPHYNVIYAKAPGQLGGSPDGASRENGQSGAGGPGAITVEWITETWPTS